MRLHHIVVSALALSVACSRASSVPPTVSPSPSPAAVAAPAVATPTSAPVADAELTVTSPARATLLAVGDAAPLFRATTHDGRRVESTGEARPRVLVVYFYPRDETPGCTREACSFRDASRAYDEAGADIAGVSMDTKDSHTSFARNHQLPFGLVADPQGQLARAFGLDTSRGIAPRVTFVIGRDGRVAQVFPNVSVDGHSEAVLAAVRAAQGQSAPVAR